MTPEILDGLLARERALGKAEGLLDAAAIIEPVLDGWGASYACEFVVATLKDAATRALAEIPPILKNGV